MLSKRDRTLGVTKESGGAVLPLGRGGGAGFLVLLIALMVFLAGLALAATFMLSALTARWSSALQDKATVEIAATDDHGRVRPHGETQAVAEHIADMLRQRPGVTNVHVLTDDEIAKLVQPWLGGGLTLAGVPLPGMISLTMPQADATTLAALGAQVHAMDARATLDSYENWLGDVVRFAHALQFAAGLLSLITGVITAAMVAGAAQARMAVSREDIEILHLMGAPDGFILRQFQRHALRLGLTGAVAGLVICALALALVGFLAGRSDISLVPGFSLSPTQWLELVALLPAACLLAWFSTSVTVRRMLLRLP